MKITIAISHPKPPPSFSSVSDWTHEARQQYSEFFVNVAVPLQKVPDAQTCPSISSHVSSATSKFSGDVPCGRTNMLSGICRRFWVSFWVYDMLIVPWKWPGVVDSISSVRFWIPLAGMSWRSCISMKSRDDVIWRLDRLSFPKLKSSIVSWVLLSVNVSISSSSVSARRSVFVAGDSNVMFSSDAR